MFRRNAAPTAVLRQPSEPWYHVTHPANLPSIEAYGLLAVPPRRTYAEGHYASVGGIYVCPDRYLRSVVRFLQIEHGTRAVAVLKLRLLAGTRFCLDEDELGDWHGENEVEIAEGVDATLFQHALEATAPEYKRRVFDERLQREFDQTIVVPEEVQKARLDEWSCRLACALDQDYLQNFRLRLFDAPEILRTDVL